MRRKTCVVVGAGITGATAAWYLTRSGNWDAVIYETGNEVGGQLRAVFHNGIPTEPHGPHIFHTASEEAYQIVRDNCKLSGYQHHVKTICGPRGDDYQLTWPLQVNELKNLPEWPQIREELNSRPADPDRTSFESYAIDVTGKTLYDWCVYGYTLKHWGCEPKLLSSSFAPKRLVLRDDDDPRFFRDPYQGWCDDGWHTLVENLLKSCHVEMNHGLQLDDLPSADAYIITAPLDDFLSSDPLPWRGVRTEFIHHPGAKSPLLKAPIINYPDFAVPFTRAVETSQMSSVLPDSGTVIGYEYPGAPVRHYPVDDTAGENRARHRELVKQLRKEVPNAEPAGRLALYCYINIDQAVIQGLNAARKVMKGIELP